MLAVRVFISYSHDSDAHRLRVAQLSERLRVEGVETVLDRYHPTGAPDEGWQRWMIDELERASHVLCICTPTYCRRFLGHERGVGGLGVDFEGAYISGRMYASRSRSGKWIAAVFSPDDVAHIPPMLDSRTHYVLDSEVGYRALYDALMGQAGLKPGPIGQPIVRLPETVQPWQEHDVADPRSLDSFAKQYCRTVATAVQRIEPARVGGEGKTRSLPLRKLYISLMADATSFEERQKARAIDEQVTLQARHVPGDWRDVLLRPSESGFARRLEADEIPGDVKRAAPVSSDGAPDAAAATGAAHGETLNQVVRRERCCVLLGDPGSGKSVLCRWLAHELAECHANGERSPALGPARVPFLIVLRELAERASEPVPSFVDYLLRLACPTPLAHRAAEWRQFVAQTLKHGSAFVILDGLDEVPRELVDRLLPLIEAFTRETVAASAVDTTRPDSGRGHQILITSRRTGYYQNALRPPFNHFAIRPMTDEQITGFCRQWCAATDRAAMAQALLGEIFDPRRPSLHSMARNPLLLSILCQLGTGDPKKLARLPAIRAELYEKVVYETADQWRRTAMASLGERRFVDLLAGLESVLALFAPVAHHMHARLLSAEIGRDELQERLVKALAWFEGKTDHELDPTEWNERQDFLVKAVERVVGVLSERQPGRYQFLHLTFQEYLAGISLLLCDAEDRHAGAPVLGIGAQLLVDRIVAGNYLRVARWRQPLLLLCGQLAWMEMCTRHGQQRVAPRLAEVIQRLDGCQAEGKLGLLGEQWAMFLAEVLAEVPEESLLHWDAVNELLVRTIGQLIDAYGRFGPRDDYARGRVVFAERLAVIRRRIGTGAFEQVLFRACLAQPDARLGAAAHLVLARAWLTQSAVDFFFEQRDRDGAAWRWAIHRLLRQAATVEPLVMVAPPQPSLATPAPEAARQLQWYRAGLPEWQRLCEEHTERVRPDAPLRPSALRTWPNVAPAVIDGLFEKPADALLGVAILGGFGDHDARLRAETYQQYAQWLAQASAAREAQVDAEPWRYVPWFGAVDPVYGMAVHLDTFGKDLYTVARAPRMQPELMVRPGALAAEVLHRLADGVDPSAVLIAAGRDPALAVDCAEVIAVCRVCGADAVERALGRLRPGEIERVAWHVERIQSELLDACHRGAKSLKAWLASLRDSTVDAEWQLALRTLASAWAASGVLGWQAKATAPPTAGPGAASDLGEAWGRAFVGIDDDRVYSFAVALDTLWTAVTPQRSQVLLRAIIRSAAFASIKPSLPDLLELGTGALTFPPLAVYETVIALRDVVSARIGNDVLAGGWVSLVLRSMRAMDPPAESYARYYGDNDDAGDRFRMQVAEAFLDWRALLAALVVPAVFGGMDALVVRAAPERLSATWLSAWETATDPEYRLTLARDAATLGLTELAEIGRRVEQLLTDLDLPWRAEGALLAGCLARSVGDAGGARWLCLALDNLERCDDADWCGEIIAALEPLVDRLGNADDRRRIQRRHEALDARAAALAAGTPSRWLRTWVAEWWPAEPELRQALTAAVVVASTIDELARGRAMDVVSDAAVWRDLRRAVERHAPASEVQQLVDGCIDSSRTGSLSLTDAAADALAAIAAHATNDDRAGIARLLPLLDAPPASVVPKIRALQRDLDGRRGKLTGPAARLQRHTALWLGEARGRYSDADLAALMQLAIADDDRSSARARLLLHGKETWLGDRPARFSLSALQGKLTMEQLGVQSDAERRVERHRRLSYQALYEWSIDDPDVLDGWLAALSRRPDDAALLRTVFRPWRWAPDCLVRWNAWAPTIRDPRCLRQCAEWLAVLYAARAEPKTPLPDDRCPPIPDWLADDVPDISWLPRTSADELVFGALAAAVRESKDLAEIVDHAEQRLGREVRSLRAAHRDRGTLRAAYEQFGDALIEILNEEPETALKAITDPTRLNETFVTALMHWTRRSLASWDQKRLDASNVLRVTCVSQLSLLASLFVQDLWPNAIRVAAGYASGGTASDDLPPWPALLCNVIRYFPNRRIVQAAWTLLARVTGPDDSLHDLWPALQCSVNDVPIVRDRALSMLFSQDGRALVAALPADSLRQALDAWREEARGQTVLATAKMFAAIALKPGTDPTLRQEIQNRLRERTADPGSHRRLFRMQGTGGKGEERFEIVAERMLEEELRILDLDLLTQAPALYG